MQFKRGGREAWGKTLRCTIEEESVSLGSVQKRIRKGGGKGDTIIAA